MRGANSAFVNFVFVTALFNDQASSMRIDPNHRDNRRDQQWVPSYGLRATQVNGSAPLVARSLAMRLIRDRLSQIGDRPLILIEGEAGCGKQFLAKQIRLPRAAEGPMLDEEASGLLSCGDSLDASNLDAPNREATKDALAALSAAFERAGRGALLLRGIDELTEPLQLQLLRLVRSFESTAGFPRSAANGSLSQLICTCRRPLRAMVLAGKFLPELYYRLSAVSLAMPALRDRKEDIPGLAQAFVDTFARESRKPLQGLGPGSLAVLLRHPWPGNVRELESVVRAACLSATGQWLKPIDLSVLPAVAAKPAAPDPFLPQDLSLEGVQRRHIQRVLQLCGGNKARAAARLGISRSTLYRMLGSESSGSEFGAAQEPDQTAAGAPSGAIQAHAIRA